MKKRKEPKSNKPRHNHKQERERGRREGRRGQGWSMPQLQPRIAIVQLSGVQWGTWIITDEYLSVVILSTRTTHATWCRG